MIHSMTAFARREAEIPSGKLAWELRSVNHRYLDVGLRLPEELRALEPRVREAIQGRVKRGKVDAGLWFARTAGTQTALDAEQLRRLTAAAEESQRLAGSRLEPLRAIDVLRWPGVLKGDALDVEGLGEAALVLLGQALDELAATRAREGARLREFLLARLASMENIVNDTKQLLPDIQRLYRERLETRLKEIKEQLADRTEARAAGQGWPGGGLDPARLEQEIVLFANRTDVAEELDRLTAHLAEIRRVLSGGEQIGRRLDFLMQELNREANTLASKSADLRQTNAAVELKVLIDQMREQIQNIE